MEKQQHNEVPSYEDLLEQAEILEDLITVNETPDQHKIYLQEGCAWIRSREDFDE